MIDILFNVTYGSKLYGTSTLNSDTDVKVVYLPDINDVLLGKRMPAFKKRFDATGNPLLDSAVMPANGVETEYITFQTFVRDFVAGQTYAVEVAWALYNVEMLGCTPMSKRELELLRELVQRFSNADVYSMVSFAQKQTFDYVHRGARLNEATNVKIALIEAILAYSQTEITPRLDSIMRNGMTVLDVIAKSTGLKTSVSVNNNKSQRTLELNGRSYLESTRLDHILEQVQKLVDKYGERTTAAAKDSVDFKSLSHAVRVYQQSIELLDTGKITFPRPNVQELLEIKQGSADLEVVKAKLLELDAEVQAKMLTSTMRKLTPELRVEAEQWLVQALRELYDLNKIA